MDNTTSAAHQHNTAVALRRMWSVIALAETYKAAIASGNPFAMEVASEALHFEIRRYKTAMFALSTTEVL